MRFTWIALVVSMLVCLSFVGGCDNSEKKSASSKGMVTPPKNKNPKGLEHPRVPDWPSKRR
jgi:hypothetical protein